MQSHKVKKMLESIIDTWKIIKKKPYLFGMSFILDSILLFLYFTLSYLGFSALMPKLMAINNLMVEYPELLTANIGSGAPIGIPRDVFLQFKEVFSNIVEILSIYALFIFILFAIFLGINKYHAFKMFKKVKFFTIFIRFTLVFLVYYILFIIFAYFSIRWSISTLFQSEGMINIFLLVISSLLVYMMLYSTSIINKYNFKQTFIKTFKNMLGINYFLTFIIIISLFIAVHLLSILIQIITFGSIGYIIWLIITALMFIFTVNFTRLFLIKRKI